MIYLCTYVSSQATKMRFSDLIAFDSYTVKLYMWRTSDFISADALIAVKIMPYCGQKVKMQIPLRPCWFLCERFYEQPCTREGMTLRISV